MVLDRSRMIFSPRRYLTALALLDDQPSKLCFLQTHQVPLNKFVEMGLKEEYLAECKEPLTCTYGEGLSTSRAAGVYRKQLYKIYTGITVIPA